MATAEGEEHVPPTEGNETGSHFGDFHEVENTEDSPSTRGTLKSKKERKLEEIKKALERPLPVKFLLEAVEKDNLSKQLARDLVIYVGFIIAFLFFSFFQRNTVDEFYSAEPIRRVLVDGETPPTLYHIGAPQNEGPHWKKTFVDLRSPDEFYSWFEGVAIPTFFDNLDRATPRSRSSLAGVGGASLTIGSLRVRRVNVKADSCPLINEYFSRSNTTGVGCFADYSPDRIDKRTFINTDVDLIVKYIDTCPYTLQSLLGRELTYDCGGHIIDFSLDMTFAQALELARKLRFSNFVDHAATRLLVLEFFLFNAASDTFTGSKLFIEITPGGGWMPNHRIKGFRVYTDSGYGEPLIIYSFCFFVFVSFYLLRFLLGWFWHARKTKKVLGFLFDMWHFLEVVNLAVFFAAFAFTWKWWKESPLVLKTTVFPMNGLYPDGLSYLMELWYVVNYLNAINSVLTFIQLLRYFRMNNRLNILTRTVEAALQSIIGVLIIFVLVILAYALCGQQLYGSAVEDYRSLGNAWTTLFLTLMGSFDYNALREENKGITFMYFWSFIVLGLFVLLNFLIAILGNSFDQEADRTAELPIPVVVRRVTRYFRLLHFRDWFSRFVQTAVLRTRRLREDVVSDYLAEHRRSLLADDNLNEQVVDEGAEDEPEYQLTREGLGRLIPANQKHHVTDLFLDELWLEVGEEYDATQNLEAAADEKHQQEVIVTGMARGFVGVLLTEKEDLRRAQATLAAGDATESTAATDALQALATATAQRRGSGNGRRGSSVADLAKKRGLHHDQSGSSGQLGSTRSSDADEDVADRASLALTASREDEAVANLGGTGTTAADVRRRAALRSLCIRAAPTAAPGIKELELRVAHMEQALLGARTLVAATSHKVAAVVSRLDSKRN